MWAGLTAGLQDVYESVKEAVAEEEGPAESGDALAPTPLSAAAAPASPGGPSPLKARPSRAPRAAGAGCTRRRCVVLFSGGV